jgi:exodeoxyribonuclease VII small subunit
MAAKKQTDKELSVEDKLARLDAIVEQLEQEDTTLTEAMRVYTEGIGLVKDCEQMLEQVEQKMTVLGTEDEQGDTQ